MLNIIVAVDKKYGIGNDNKLPWKIPEEIKLFKEKTKNCVCIVGNKTYDLHRRILLNKSRFMVIVRSL